MGSFLSFTSSTAFGINNAYGLIENCLKSHLISNPRQSFESQFCRNQLPDFKSYLTAIEFDTFKNASVIFNSTFLRSRKSGA